MATMKTTGNMMEQVHKSDVSVEDQERDVSAMGSHHTCRAHHVHDSVYRSHEHLARPAATQPGPPFGSATGGNGRRHFLLGLRQEIYQYPAGRMGQLCGGLWSGTNLSRALVASFVPRLNARSLV